MWHRDCDNGETGGLADDSKGIKKKEEARGRYGRVEKDMNLYPKMDQNDRSPTTVVTRHLGLHISELNACTEANLKICKMPPCVLFLNHVRCRL